MPILEYYAFEARSESPEAANRYRALARKGLAHSVYALVGHGLARYRQDDSALEDSTCAFQNYPHSPPPLGNAARSIPATDRRISGDLLIVGGNEDAGDTEAPPAPVRAGV
jgi:hypothetical protein